MTATMVCLGSGSVSKMLLIDGVLQVSSQTRIDILTIDQMTDCMSNFLVPEEWPSFNLPFGGLPIGTRDLVESMQCLTQATTNPSILRKVA